MIFLRFHYDLVHFSALSILWCPLVSVSVLWLGGYLWTRPETLVSEYYYVRTDMLINRLAMVSVSGLMAQGSWLEAHHYTLIIDFYEAIIINP